MLEKEQLMRPNMTIPSGWTTTPAGPMLMPFGVFTTRQGLKLMNDEDTLAPCAGLQQLSAPQNAWLGMM